MPFICDINVEHDSKLPKSNSLQFFPKFSVFMKIHMGSSLNPVLIGIQRKLNHEINSFFQKSQREKLIPLANLFCANIS
jgi:hypothetical protein